MRQMVGVNVLCVCVCMYIAIFYISFARCIEQYLRKLHKFQL